MITDRELLQATAQRKREERIFYYAEFVDRCWDKVSKFYGITDRTEFSNDMGFYCPVNVSPERKQDAPVFDYSNYFKGVEIPEGVSIDCDGVLNLPCESQHFTHLISPLRDIFEVEELMKFPIYKRKEYYDFSSLKQQVDAIHAKGQIAQAWVGRLFEASWPFRGYENLLADMICDPDIAEYFLNIELDWNLEYTKQAVLAGADLICYGDDVGTQKAMTFSADLWRKMLKPKWQQIFNTAKSLNKNVVIWYHSCGHITEIIPDLIEVGLDILNPIQPECMDIYDIQKKYGDKISFDGGLGTQGVMPFGSVSDVINETKHLVEIFGANGGYILSPSHVLEPETPVENIAAFLKTAKQICLR